VAPIHAHEGDGAVPARRCGVTEGLLQERCEGRRGHLADAHCELAMAHPAKPAYMAVDRHVVGRIREQEIRALALHEPRDGFSGTRVTA
jgi:hypothetical protein